MRIRQETLRTPAVRTVVLSCSEKSLKTRSQSKKTKASSVKEAVVGYLELFAKTTPLILLTGAILLMVYLKKNDLSGMFLMAISSPQGLIAFSIGGLLVSFLVALSLLMPPLLASFVRSAGEDLHIAILRIPIWFGSLLFCAVFSIFLLSSEPLSLVIKVVLTISLVSLLFWFRWIAGFRQFVVVTIAVTLGFFAAVFAVLIIANGGKFYHQSETDTLIFWFIYLAISGWLVTIVLVGKNLKRYTFLAIFGLAISLICLARYSDFVADKAAEFLELRHNDLRWYWVSKDAATKFVPHDMRIFRKGRENYIHVSSKFSFGDVRYLCTQQKPESPRSEALNTQRTVCVMLDKSEARWVDPTYFDSLK